MRLGILIGIFFFNFLFAKEAFSQADCECEDLQITLCYLPAGNYCNTDGNSLACGYAIDGRHMNNYLRQKLENANNFGVNGVVQCPIDLVPLSRDIDVNYLEQQECDIIFTGNFTLDTITLQVNTEVTSIPEYTLSQIKEWSEKCETNLVIISQTEATLWGYTIQDLNENPNFSVGNELGDFIFDGPFGKVESFNQGGTYQGVIVNEPLRGYTSLGVDNNGRPTLVIDNATNDIILGDIGIFCGGSTGSVSLGPNINNDNDRLTANIFALVCQLAGAATETVEVYLCPGEEYLSPLGSVITEEGTYVDSLKTANNCDSVLTTVILTAEEPVESLFYDGCSGDGFGINVGGNLYNENNPDGVEILQTIHGCDSTVNISFTYKEISESIYEDEICNNDFQGVSIGDNVFNANNPIGEAILVAANGCDSIVNVFLEVLPENKRSEEYKICRGESIQIYGKTFDRQEEETFTYPAANGCDSLVVVEVDFYPPIPPIAIKNPLEVKLNNDYYVNLAISEDYSIQWSPEQLVSCTDCFEFFIKPDLQFDKLLYTISNNYGCSESDTIFLDYDCPIYIPNAFYPTSESFENQSFFIQSPCLELISDFEMSIYDRWGNLVYVSEDPYARWDGKLKSEDASVGVYVYLMKYTSLNRDQIIAGDVSLLR